MFRVGRLRVGLVAVLVFCATLGGCVPGWSSLSRPIGIERDGDRLVAYTPECLGTKPIVEVTVYEFDPKAPPGTRSENVLWRMTSEVGTFERSFTLGEVIEGFHEDVPMEVTMPSRPIDIYIIYSGGVQVAGDAVSPHRQKDKVVYVGGRPSSLEHLEDFTTCPDEQ